MWVLSIRPYKSIKGPYLWNDYGDIYKDLHAAISGIALTSRAFFVGMESLLEGKQKGIERQFVNVFFVMNKVGLIKLISSSSLLHIHCDIRSVKMKIGYFLEAHLILNKKKWMIDVIISKESAKFFIARYDGMEVREIGPKKSRIKN